MFNLKKALRENILNLSPYTSARDEFTGKASIFLDANENAYGSATASIHSRYPDPKHLNLRKKVSEVKAVPYESIFVGNGSDEAIDLIIRLFCKPGSDKILSLYPSYGMYKVSADTNDVGIKLVDLRPDFTLDAGAVINSLENDVKAVFICNPNNPTGNAFPKDEILKIADACRKNNTVLVVDEAYIDFCLGFSMLPEIQKFENIVVLQTLSKAWGLAEVRLGLAFSSKEIIEYMYKVKAPYNVSGVTQKIALEALTNSGKKDIFVEGLLREKERLVKALSSAPGVEKIFPSDANYILVKVKGPEEKFRELLNAGIVVRDRSKARMCEGCFRVTVGREEENDALIAAFLGKTPDAHIKSIENTSSIHFNYRRSAKIQRKTSETDVSIEVDLDGSGEAKIETGLGFFDHMLTQIAKHGGVDLSIKVLGDLKVDEHHTIEDTAIGLGEAFIKALGDKKGIERYGFLLPMDESLAQVALDFSGRSALVWDAEFKREKIGDMPTEMFPHFFKSFADSAKCNINIKASGENEHHKIEAIFKAFAKSIRQAIRRDPNNSKIPSSKGVL